MDSLASDTAPNILENLVAAGLVSHELIGDPARLAGEAATLAALCARISGPIYRIEAFHYAFRIAPGDLDGALDATDPSAWGEALADALAAEFGAEAVWVNAAELACDAEAGFDARQILFLKAADGAATAALTEAPEIAAVINAGIAARSAEAAAALAGEAINRAACAAGAESAALARAVGMLAARIEELESGLKQAVETATGAAMRAALGDALGESLRQGAADPALERVAAALAALGERVREQAVRQDALASGIAALDAAFAAERHTLAGFEDRLGLTLAEFLAQIAPQGAPAGQAAAAQVVETGRDEAKRQGRGGQHAPEPRARLQTAQLA